MSYIEIENELYLIKMELVAIDEYLPSMKIKVQVNVQHPTGYYEYCATDIWFQSSKWDDFIKRLSTNNYDKFSLTNMDESFNIHLNQTEQERKLIFSFKERIYQGEGVLSISLNLNDDQLSIFKREFLKFSPPW